MHDFAEDLCSKEQPHSAHMLPRKGGMPLIFLQSMSIQRDANRPGQLELLAAGSLPQVVHQYTMVFSRK